LADHSADAAVRRLDPRSIAMERVAGWIAAAVITAGLVVGALIVWAANRFPLAGGLALLLAAPAAGLALGFVFHAWAATSYRHTSYVVDADGIEIRRGVFWRKVITIPRSRVQHTDVSQGPLERSYQLGTLVVYTAGTDHAKVALSGLAHDTALALRQHLLARDSDDAV